MGCGSSKDVLNVEKVDMSHFEMGSCIGKGGFGKVCAVIHKGTGVQMACKKLAKIEIVQNDWQIQSVWVERNLLELLDSPYVSRLYFAFQDDYELYLIMPYMRGGDLNFYLQKKGKMKVNQIQYYGAELVLAFAELRRLGIVYRDFKPENCLFNDSGHVLITDFGVCGQLKKTEHEKNDNMLCDKIGTPQYMSPEQYLKKPYNFCCDYFALGLVLYEMFTAKRFFDTKERQINLETDNFYQNKINPNISSPYLKDLCQKLICSDRTKRLGVNNINEIFNHTFFQNINWTKFKTCEQNEKPPYIPDTSQVNCGLDNLAMDAFGDDEPSDGKKPNQEQQKHFEDFNFNTKPTKQWLEHWDTFRANCKNEKILQKEIAKLWDKPIDLNSFKPPKSEFMTKSNDIDIMINIDINKCNREQLISLKKSQQNNNNNKENSFSGNQRRKSLVEWVNGKLKTES